MEIVLGLFIGAVALLTSWVIVSAAHRPVVHNKKPPKKENRNLFI